MSKKSRVFLMLVLSGLLSFVSMNVKAQGQDANFQWVGNDPSTVIANSNPDKNKVYLYNVGTGKYLNVGDVWGTAINAYNVGLELELHSVGTDTYTIQGALTTTDGNFLGFPYVKSKDDNADKQSSWDRVFCDRTTNNANVHWIIKPASNYSATNKIYTLYCDNSNVPSGPVPDDPTDHYVQPTTVNVTGNRYLVVKSGVSSSNRILYDYPTADPSAIGNKNGEWKLVTLDDLKKAFKAQFASAEAPADATFLMSDPDFVRSHKGILNWTVTGFHATPQKDNGGKEIYAFDVTSNTSPNTYYVGVGQFNGWPDTYTRVYGSYWNASIRNLANNTNANGAVSQKVTTLKKGWYKVSCDGFFSPGTGSGMKASLFANVDGTTDGRSNVSAMLNTFGKEFTYDQTALTKIYKKADAIAGTESPYVKAAKLFETGKYNNSILVYVPADGAKLNVGIKVEDSYKPLDWTVFDNFQLKYCGDNDMILDESQASISYLNKQGLQTTNAYTLILKRTLTPGQWASITLPVNLTAAQFKTAFGDQAKLSTFVGQDAVKTLRLKFESVDLSNDNEVVLKANTLYIMKTTRAANVTTGSYTKNLQPHGSLTVQAPYYTINNVVPVNLTPSETFKEAAKASSTVNGTVQFCGSFVSKNSFIPAKSYVIGAKDGKWYYTNKALNVKGFRSWIEVNGSAPAKALSIFVDDEDVTGVVTGIEGVGVAADGNAVKTPVYNLQGQKVAENDSQLDTLPAGVYIVNNKKVFVK
ncbi:MULTISPECIES: adhesin [Prevotella]|uniref:adhesin n=1 Tax=Prevotella melaninogenica TaxID=28132 RepID=UPI002150F54B|nr:MULTISPECIES: adhesin [Prevotella]